MTDELLKQANKLSYTITALENQIARVEDMHHCDGSLTLSVKNVGTIIIEGDDELKDDILDMILNRLNIKKGEVEDEYREL